MSRARHDVATVVLPVDKMMHDRRGHKLLEAARGVCLRLMLLGCLPVLLEDLL